MLKPHEQIRAGEITDALREVFKIDILAESPGGPYGRTLAAITAYRRLGFTDSHGAQKARALIAELLCVYAVGIVRGDGEGIAPDIEGDNS